MQLIKQWKNTLNTRFHSALLLMLLLYAGLLWLMSAWALGIISGGKILTNKLLGYFALSESTSDQKVKNWKNLPEQRFNLFYFKITEWYERGEYLAVKINYPDSKHYEGNKILVYQNVKIERLKSMLAIDPHFSLNKDVPSPIARFEANEEGWVNAMKFCSMLHSERLQLSY